MISREEFEGKPEWRATIKRAGNIAFILALMGRFYEYPEDWIPRIGPAQPLEIEMDCAWLHLQLINGEIELLKGVLHQNIKGSHA
jgi:hypothetical protein